MRIAVMGAGAVGGYFGARLAAAANDVAFIARGSHLMAMRREGLNLESPQGNLQIRDALFTNDPTQVGVVDLVLFCVKSYATDETAAKLTSLIGDRTTILSLQNGVDNADKIAQRWGNQRTLAGVVYIGSQLLQPGKIKLRQETKSCSVSWTAKSVKQPKPLSGFSLRRRFSARLVGQFEISNGASCCGMLPFAPSAA